MARVEREIEIGAPQKKIFDILDNTLESVRWNLPVRNF